MDQQELCVLQIKDSWYKLNTILNSMFTEIFHTQLLRYEIPCQSVYAHVVSWALSNQKSKHFFLSVLFSCNFILFFIISLAISLFIIIYIYIFTFYFYQISYCYILLGVLLLVLIVKRFGSQRERRYINLYYYYYYYYQGLLIWCDALWSRNLHCPLSRQAFKWSWNSVDDTCEEGDAHSYVCVKGASTALWSSSNCLFKLKATREHQEKAPG